MSVLHDESIMPFGIHAGEEMANVPECYLIWLHKSGKLTNDVRDYIEDTIDEKLLK